MFANIRALVVVLIVAIPTFYIGRQIALSYVARREFVLWRNAWIAVTICAFLSSNFFVYSLIVAIICLYARRLSGSTLPLFFLLLFAAPQVDIAVNGFGIVNELLAINNGRVLATVLLLPLLITRSGGQRRIAYSAPDWLVICYVVLLVALEFQRSDITGVMRTAVVLSLDILVPYFAFSRAVTNIPDLRKICIAFIIAALLLALFGFVEVAKSWHLYAGVAETWRPAFPYNATRRNGLLRAIVTAGDPIDLGYVLMVATGCALGSFERGQWRKYAWAIYTILAVGLLATFSRGPWLGTIILVTAYLAMGPSPLKKLMIFLFVGSIVVGGFMLTGLGDAIINMLPFVGGADQADVTYRQLLVQNGLEVLQGSPWFGAPDYLSTPQMQLLMQGEGIIDTVNSYLQIALNSGVIGLGVFVGFFSIILVKLRRVIKVYQEKEVNQFARALAATLLAILVTIATVSSVEFIPYIYWSFAGMSVALIRILHQKRVTPERVRGAFAGQHSESVTFASGHVSR